MKFLSLLLAFTIILQVMPVYAQVHELEHVVSPVVEIKSCQEQLREKLKKLPLNIAGKTLAAGSATTYGLGAFIWYSSVSVGFNVAYAAQFVIWNPLIFAGTAATGITIMAIRKHRKNILEILEGSGTGGNKKTEKLWKMAKKKSPKAFQGLTYEKFLADIHASDVSGKACETEVVPERKDLLNVVIDLNDLEDKENIIGEKTKTPIEAKDGTPSDVRKEIWIPG